MSAISILAEIPALPAPLRHRHFWTRRLWSLYARQHEKALKILQDNIGKLHELAKYLYEHETITGEEFMKILEGPSEIPGVSLTKE